MKKWSLTLCLLVQLVGGRALSAGPIPPPSPPVEQAASSPAPQAEPPPRASGLQRIEDEARRLDPAGRLTSQQLYDLLREQEARRTSRSNMDITAAILGVSFFSTLLAGFLAWLLARDRKARRLHETVRLMVEKGVEIPQGLLAPVARHKPSDLRRGIVLCTTGLGLTVFLAVLPDLEGAWGAGVTLLLVGAGHLLLWRLQQGRGPLAAALAPQPQR